MDFLFSLILLVIGFIFLIKGADIFVDGASDTAQKFKVPKMLIGLTIVSFGTSAPELAVSIQSILTGKGDILLGNVIGSNILNILLILGLSSLVGMLHVNTATVKKELPVLTLVTLAFSIVLVDKIFGLAKNEFTQQDGIMLLLFFCVFIYYLVGMAKRTRSETDEKTKQFENNKLSESTNKVKRNTEVVVSSNKEKINKRGKVISGKREDNEKKGASKGENIIEEGSEIDKKPVELRKALFMVVVGLIGIVVGSDFVVRGASNIATIFNVSQRLISLTIVALGTSLPELVTSVMATRKGEYDIAIGNVVGSNIFNIGIVAGLPVALFGGVAGSSFSYLDVGILLVSAVLLFLFARHGRRIGYKKGAIFLTIFVAYYTYVIISGMD